MTSSVNLSQVPMDVFIQYILPHLAKETEMSQDRLLDQWATEYINWIIPRWKLRVDTLPNWKRLRDAEHVYNGHIVKDGAIKFFAIWGAETEIPYSIFVKLNARKHKEHISFDGMSFEYAYVMKYRRIVRGELVVEEVKDEESNLDSNDESEVEDLSDSREV